MSNLTIATKNYNLCKRTFRMFKTVCVKNNLEPVQIRAKINALGYITDDTREAWDNLEHVMGTCAPIEVQLSSKQFTISPTKGVYVCIPVSVTKDELLSKAKEFGYNLVDLFFDMSSITQKVYEINGRILRQAKYKNAELGRSDERYEQLKLVYQLNRRYNTHVPLPKRAYTLFANDYDVVKPTKCTITKAQFENILFYAEAYGVSVPMVHVEAVYHGKDVYNVYSTTGTITVDKKRLAETLETINYLASCGDDYLMPGFRRDGNRLYRTVTAGATGKYVHDEGIYVYDTPEEELYTGYAIEQKEIATYRPVDKQSRKETVIYKDFNDVFKALQQCKDTLED